MPDNYKDSYLSVIEFNKVIVSIASTILAALISYLVFQEYDFTFRNLISPIVIFISLILSLFGFGNAIPAIKKDQSRKWAIRASNAAASFMFIGIGLIGFIQPKKDKTINDILKYVESSSINFNHNLIPNNCSEISFINRDYILKYNLDSIVVKTIYSLDDDKMTLLQKEFIPLCKRQKKP